MSHHFENTANLYYISVTRGYWMRDAGSWVRREEGGGGQEDGQTPMLTFTPSLPHPALVVHF